MPPKKATGKKNAAPKKAALKIPAPPPASPSADVKHALAQPLAGDASPVGSAPPVKKKPKAKSVPGVVYQFKLTLLGSKPPIWRRIQVEDCTLAKFHEHIQTAMGWSNSHLYQFDIDRQPYGDPAALDDVEVGDASRTRLSQILSSAGAGYRFLYQYDFGDSWDHEILVEDYLPLEPAQKHPCCLEGRRACPPEDCGGIWGYTDLLKTLGKKTSKKRGETLDWIGGSFDPEAFDPAAITLRMQAGLPDWRF